jgi:LmbE family N-acetylglucosaminyl deacetylase
MNKSFVNIIFLLQVFTMLITGMLLQVSLAAQEYNKRADYNYAFDTSQARIVGLIPDKNNFSLTALNQIYQTAFLEVDIKTSISGWLAQPKVELMADNLLITQYFEFGAKGKRFINLSEFVQKGVRNVRIITKHCHIKGKEHRLILYKNPPIAEAKLLVLAPHPDDAEIAAYGLYAENSNATVVNVTIGDAGKKMYDELYANDTIHYLKKAHLRLWNSITVPLLAGIDPGNCVNLGYFDATLKAMYLNPEKPVKPRYTGMDDIQYFREQNISSFLDTLPAQVTWTSLISDLKHILMVKQPTVIVSPYPAIDVHPDHKLTTLALLQALQELDFPDVKLYLYTNHFVHSELHPTGKKGSLISLPPNTSDDTIYFQRLHSHTLDEILQSDKVLALEAMNPLRPDTEWHSTRGSWKLFTKTWRENIRNTEQDYYYRRAVRNNELFFVVHSKEILNKPKNYNMVMGNMDFLKE